jgi:hypothetical protein
VIRVTLPVRTVSLLNEREHWSKRAARAAEHRALAHMLVKPQLRAARLELPVRVTMTRVAPCELDDDNLRGALKAARDGVADALGVDDRSPRVQWVYDQRRGNVREYAVVIEIEKRV